MIYTSETRFKNNMQTLEKILPDLHKWVKEGETPDWYTRIQSIDGSPNLLIKHGAQVKPAYPQRIPARQAKSMIKDRKFLKEDVSVIIGFGLGYLIREIILKMEKGHRIIIVEPTPGMYKQAFNTFDFTKQMDNGSIIFASPGQAEIAYIISVIETSIVVSEWNFFVEPYTFFRPDEYKKIMEYTIETINQARCNTGTVIGAGKMLADNDIYNLPYVIRHRGVAELKGLFKNKPAVLICTGPSLEKNIHELIPIQDKVIIIAVAQALRILLAYDIRPDFITTVDFGEPNMGHYNGLMDSDIPLVCLNRTCWKILKKYQGPKFIVATPIAEHEKAAVGVIAHKGSLEAGGSVAHLSLMLAHHLGCNPAMLLGQDLALTGNKSHFKLADQAGITETDPNTGAITIKWQDHRWENTDAAKAEHKDGTSSMGPPIYVQGNLGNVVTTNAGLASFILAFKNLIKRFFSEDQFVLNCTEDGAKIEGAKCLSFHKAIDTYCQEAIDKSILDPLLSLADDRDKLLKEVIPKLENDIQILEDIEEKSKKALESCDPLVKSFSKPHKLKRLIKESETITKEAERAAGNNALIGVAIFNASRQIHSRSLKVKGQMSHLQRSKKDLKIRVKRTRIILTAARDASIELQKGYKTALKLFKKYKKTKDESLLIDNTDIEPSIGDALTFFKRGNFGRPLLEARKILKECEKASKKILTLEPLTKEYQETKEKMWKFHDAKIVEKNALILREKAIKKAKLKHKQFDIDKLLEYLQLMEENKEVGKKELVKLSALQQLQASGEYEKLSDEAKKELQPDFSEALKILKKAVELYPEKEHSRWGYATTLHHTGQYKEAIKEYEKLIETVQKDMDKLRFSERQKEFLETFLSKEIDEKQYKEKLKNEEFAKKDALKGAKIIRLINKRNTYNIIEKSILRYKFELGQVKLITRDIQGGLSDIRKVMEQTEEFDSFFQRIGDLYYDLKDYEKAVLAYKTYLQKFNTDYVAWEKKGLCHLKLDQKVEAEKAFVKVKNLKPEHEFAEKT